MNATCKKRLKEFPESCPIAAESKEFDIPLRQFIIDRYRVIFTIQENTVRILYIRGSYVDATSTDSEDEEG